MRKFTTISAMRSSKRAAWTKRFPITKRRCKSIPTSAPARNKLGIALFQKGSVDEAISDFQKALQIDPDYAEGHNNLGSALLQKGRVDEALPICKRRCKSIPATRRPTTTSPTPCFKRAGWRKRLPITKRCCKSVPITWKRRIIWPRCWQPVRRHHCAMATRRWNWPDGRISLRVTGFRSILALWPPLTRRAGRFSEAVETAQRALQLAEMQSNTALAESLRSQMRLYQAADSIPSAVEKPEALLRSMRKWPLNLADWPKLELLFNTQPVEACHQMKSKKVLFFCC